MTGIKAATTLKTAQGDVLVVEYSGGNSSWRTNNIAAENEPALRALLNKRAEPEPTPEKAPLPPAQVFKRSGHWKVARGEQSRAISTFNFDEAPWPHTGMTEDDAKKEAVKFAAHLNAVEETKRDMMEHVAVRDAGSWAITTNANPNAIKARVYNWGNIAPDGRPFDIAMQIVKLLDEDAAAHG